MSFLNDIDHNEIVDGLRYAVIKTKEDMQRAEDFYFDIFLEGEHAIKDAKALNGCWKKYCFLLLVSIC